LFSLIALPICRWLNGESGTRFIEILVKLVSKRGSIFLWVIPLAVTQIVLKPSFPEQHDWADFWYQFLFLVYGYLLFKIDRSMDQRLLKALKKDWWLILVFSFVSSVLILSTVSSSTTDLSSAPSSMVDLIIRWGVFSINSWFWTVLLLLFGMKYLGFDNTCLKYGKEAILPFYLIHHPVIIVIAFYVVQWDTSMVIKYLSILGGSFMITIGIFELLIKRISFIRNLLGVKQG